MKSLLTTLSAIVLGSTGVIPIIANINSDVKPSVTEIIVKAPIQGTFLEDSSSYTGDDLHGVWSYMTVNLGRIAASKVTGVTSTYDDSYSEHRVDARDYYTKSYDGGMHHRGQFQKVVFRQGQANPNWDLNTVWLNTQTNFISSTIPGKFDHKAETGIKYWWHYNSNGELLVDIVSIITFDILSYSGESFASVNLGSWFTFYYEGN